MQNIDEPIEELSVVRLLAGVEVAPDRYLPEGTLGTVVSVYEGGKAYHVEFEHPFHALEIVAPDKLSLVAEATRERVIDASKHISGRRG